jgi:hypothetical protein
MPGDGPSECARYGRQGAAAIDGAGDTERRYRPVPPAMGRPLCAGKVLSISLRLAFRTDRLVPCQTATVSERRYTDLERMTVEVGVDNEREAASSRSGWARTR